VDNPWHSGAADIVSYEIEELLGTKLRALYQRRKGRDLFDLSEALTRLEHLDREKVVACFARYLDHDGQRVTRAEFEHNLAEKVVDEMFLSDVPPLLALGASFDAADALDRVLAAFVSRLPAAASEKPKYH
jgi:predicted nucleotidyltransferase component of viral defense system